jgi:hypothetical protein
VNLNKETAMESGSGADENPSGMSRRAFFKRATVVGATSAVAIGGLVSLASALDTEVNSTDSKRKMGGGRLTKGDRDILIAAEIAEALAVTTYSNIINTSPFFGRLPSDDQGYLAGALQEEMSHYLLEQHATDQLTPFTSLSSRPTWLECGTSAPPNCESRRRASWALRATTGRWRA